MIRRGPDPAEPAQEFTDALTVGVPETIAPGVQRVLAPNPGVMTGPGTNTYVIGTRDVTVIDPGPDDPSHIAAILDAAGGAIARIICTHTHIDHWPATTALQQQTRCAVLGFASRDGLVVTDTLADGDVLATHDAPLRIVHTPGHASNHVCVLAEDIGMLFTGDHIMQGSTVVISPPDGDMTTYLASLAKVRALNGLQMVAPAHGHVLQDPHAVIDALVAHRLQREAIVASVLATYPDGATIDAMVSEVYGDVDPAIHPVARRSLWAHLRKLVDDGRGTTNDRDDIDAARWAPTATTDPS